jgi:hypothetical protein
MNQRFCANFTAYLVIWGIPTFILAAIVWGNSGVNIDALGLAIAIAISSFAFAWCVGYQIRITSNEVVFRTLFRSQTIRHNEIQKVRLAWLGTFRRQRGDALKAPMRLIIESRGGNGVRHLDINAKVFSGSAIKAVLDLGSRVAEADDDGLREGIVMKFLREAKQHKDK